MYIYIYQYTSTLPETSINIIPKFVARIPKQSHSPVVSCSETVPGAIQKIHVYIYRYIINLSQLKWCVLVCLTLCGKLDLVWHVTPSRYVETHRS